ncbi:MULTISPECIES: hypothetical protein [Streptomyces]
MPETNNEPQFSELDDLDVIESAELKVGGAFHAFRFKSLIEADPES